MVMFNFLIEEKIEKRQYQFDDAAEIVRVGGEGKNCGLVYPTGTGKTLTAFIALDHYLPRGKVLILAHTNPLCQQHCRDARALFNFPEAEVNLLVGRVPDKKRAALWRQSLIVVATPQTIMSEINKGTIDFSNVAFVVFDEMHMANKKYDYVKIAALCRSLNIRVLGLTASSGNAERIRILEKNYGLRHWIYRSIHDEEIRRFIFPKSERPVVLDYPEEMKIALRSLRARIFKLHNDLAETKLIEPIQKPEDWDRRLPFCRLTELNELFPRLKRYVDAKKREESFGNGGATWYRYIVLYGAYYKLMHLFNLFVTEGYEIAWRYLLELEEHSRQSKDGVASSVRHQRNVAERILNNRDFARFRYILQELVFEKKAHPKTAKLFELLQPSLARGEKVLLFSNYKETLDILRAEFALKNIGADIIAGNQFMKVKDQQAVIARFAAGEFPVLLATTVVEAGIHIPKIDVVVNYSMPLTGIAQIQRGGRAGRTAVGLIYYLIMNNSNDSSLYFAARATNKTMDRALKREQRIQQIEKEEPGKHMLRVKQPDLPFKSGLPETQSKRNGSRRMKSLSKKVVQTELFPVKKE